LREATPTGGIPHKGAEKNYNRNKTEKRVTQLGAGDESLQVNYPTKFFHQVRKEPSENFEPQSQIPLIHQHLLSGKASSLEGS
jgi:hypothetical protein